MLALLAQRFYDLDIVLALLAHQLFPTCSLCGSCWMAVEHEFAVCSDIASADFVRIRFDGSRDPPAGTNFAIFHILDVTETERWASTLSPRKRLVRAGPNVSWIFAFTKSALTLVHLSSTAIASIVIATAVVIQVIAHPVADKVLLFAHF